MNDYEYDESYDESDLEAAFEDLGYDEARRRRRRGRGRRGRRGRGGAPVRLPGPPPQRDADINRARDRQLAKAISTTNEDVSDVESRLNKVNSDVGRLKQLAMITLLLPRPFDIRKDSITDAGSVPRQVEVVTNVAAKTDIIPLILFMTMAKGIGTPGRAGTAPAGDNMFPLLAIVLLQQQQTQAGGQTTTGGLDPTMLLVLMMAMGGLS